MEIELSRDILKIFQKFLIMVIFGEDIDDETISMQKFTPDTGLKREQMSLSDAVEYTN